MSFCITICICVHFVKHSIELQEYRLRLPIAWLTAFMHRFSISAFPGLLPPTWGWNRSESVRNGRLFSNASSCRKSHHVLVQVSHLLLQLRWLYVGIRHSNHNNTSKHKHKSVSFNDYRSFISSIVLNTVQYTTKYNFLQNSKWSSMHQALF